MSGKSFSRVNNKQLWWLAAAVLVLLISLKFPVGQRLEIAIAPLIHGVQAPARWFSEFSLWFDDATALQTRVLRLQNTTEKQNALKQELATVRAENIQLKRLLMITHFDGYVWQAVRVTSRSQEEKSRRLMLQVEQAKQDDIVVSHEGLVGLVEFTGSGHAVVRTILDASLAVPVTMKNSSLAALVRGDGEELLVDFVPEAKAPKAGDVLIASGAGGIFPAGLPVARVEEVKPVEGGVFVEVIAAPVASWQRDAWLAIASKEVD